MRIGCYQGERGGKLHGHRDNTEPPLSTICDVDELERGRV